MCVCIDSENGSNKRDGGGVSDVRCGWVDVEGECSQSEARCDEDNSDRRVGGGGRGGGIVSEMRCGWSEVRALCNCFPAAGLTPNL